MNLEFSTVSLLYLTAALINGCIACFAWLRRSSRGALTIFWLSLSILIYSFGYAFEIQSQTLEWALFWIGVEYLGIATLPAFWLMLCIQFTGRDGWLNRTFLTILFAVPVLTVFFNYTNGWHHLFYRSASVETGGIITNFLSVKGLFYYVNLVFVNVCMVIGSVLILIMWARSNQSYRNQASTVLLGSLLPWIGYLFYVTGKSPMGMDLIPLTSTLSILIYALALFRYRMMDLVPVAREIIFEGMRDGVLVLDTAGRLLDYNKAAEKMLPQLARFKLGDFAQGIFHPYPELKKTLNTNIKSVLELNMSMNDKSSIYHIVISPVHAKNGDVIGRLLVFRDITEETLLMERLRNMATQDDLTGCFNRRHFIDMTHREMLRAKRYGHPLSLIILDLDHFKQVNDTFGHQTGDEALRLAANVCMENLRSSDLFARYGGEEFVVLLPETPPDTALQFAERLRLSVAGLTLEKCGKTACITASFGLTGVEVLKDESLDELFRYADNALYEAKAQGRNRCVLKRIG